MKKIEELIIKSFKGIEEFRLENCGDINILVGDNNTCKTTVLEAIQFFQAQSDFREIIRIARKRDITARIPSITVLESFLNAFNAKQDDSHKKIEIGYNNEKSTNLLRVFGMVQDIYVTENDIIELSKNQRINKDNFDENEPIKEFRGILEYNQTSTEVYINEISDVYRFGDKNIPIKKEDVLKVSYLSSIDHTNERFSSRIISEAIINNEKSGLLDLLKLFDENIDGLEIVATKNSFRATTYIKHKVYGFLPVSSFGDGLKKVLALASIILSTENGILLIDEIETAIHTNALGNIFKWILELAKNRIFKFS